MWMGIESGLNRGNNIYGEATKTTTRTQRPGATGCLCGAEAHGFLPADWVAIVQDGLHQVPFVRMDHVHCH